MSAPSPTPATKSKCSPEQLERLARAREKALERRQALSALKKKEKAMADEVIKQRIRKVDELEKELMSAKSGNPQSASKPKPKPKTKSGSGSGSSKVRPPPSESESSETESESESESEEEEEQPAQKQKARREKAEPRDARDARDARPVQGRQKAVQKSSRVHTRVPAKKEEKEPDWDSLMRRVFPLD